MCGIESILLPIAAVAGSALLGPEVGLGLESLAGGAFAGEATLGGALTGAGIGAATSAIGGGNPLIGALTGGAGGAIGPNIGDIFNGVTGGSASTTPPGLASASGGSPGAGAVGATPGAAATAAPAGIAGGAGDVSLFDPTNVVAPPPTLPSGIGGGGFGIKDVLGNLPLPNAGGGSPSSTKINSSDPNSVSGAGGGGNSILNAINGKGTITDALGKNSNLLLPTAGLAFNALTGDQKPKNMSALQTQADKLSAQGDQLGSYLQTGTLPPGVQGSVNQASASAKAAIRSQYASMGLSGSSAEVQALSNVDQTAASQGAQLAMQLLSQGVNETQLSSQLYQQIMQTTLQEDQNLQNAISNFATAAAGGSGGGNTFKISAA